ncbi:DUF4405 domain-containing protein [Maribacter polysiphoniae]|uniref:DUF4405 domain-containing protein n=1 Tax=Maribacter polysiphoniae TaxID=429344 RepID=A0A316DVZ6_9FLAO|nr:DUF4405 domain-containing protein [Maribacter polysiphoniae]MBD1262535.1 DUF4405 domain-containing protein [Maribacter polysiphoniae]PWK21369.1 uncharacterized protein DUF4405 [Maribacter polysiphoniae]
MKTPTKNYIIDIVAFVCFIFLVSTGVILYYNLPKGSGHSITIWGLDRHEWGTVHFWIAVLFLLVLALHLVLHWRWIVSLTKGKKTPDSGKRVALGIVGFLAIVALAIAPIITPVESSTTNTKKENSGNPTSLNTQSIRGSMTLNDIEQETHVPISYMIEKLNLPKNISTETPLKILRSEYHFTMEDIRIIVEDYK